MTGNAQSQLIENIKASEKKAETVAKLAGTFTPNMKMPIHGWYRYSAGFSAEWAEKLIENYQPSLGVLDPFAGSGTTNLAADKLAVSSVGFEPHPFVYKIAKAKTSWNVEPDQFIDRAMRFLEEAKANIIYLDLEEQPPLLKKCYTEEVLSELMALRERFFLTKWKENEDQLKDLIWLCITSILRECSYVGTATWQYVLPNKRKRSSKQAFEAFELKLHKMAKDIELFACGKSAPLAEILLTDARSPKLKENRKFDLVVTSPPYPNNYDYADATRIEMTFWGDVEKWGELQKAARQYLLRSCSQHATAEKLELNKLLIAQSHKPIHTELTEACRELEAVRLTKGGRKSYHTMAAAYFLDLGKVFDALRPICSEGSQLCFVVGDSAPYGVKLPNDRWLAELAASSGFKNPRFEKIRDRNVKWKNRKHRVPLQEGYLWLEG